MTMRGVIERGLIELITNADDAYARQGARSGKIMVEVEHRRGTPWKVVVSDRAGGMTLNEMKERLLTVGGRTSGFESGVAVRGNLGRGAKDLPGAFGPTTWESIRNGDYSALRINPDGSYDAVPRARKASQADRSRLGIPGGHSGTVVTVLVDDHIRCPNHGTLRTRLSQHYQLRDIVNDDSREVWLINGNHPDERHRLRAPIGELPMLWHGFLNVQGYPDARAELMVKRLPEPCTGPGNDPYRPCGILIKGARAIYENSLLGFEQNRYAALFHGRLSCRYIDTLALDFEARRSNGETPLPENPMLIIGRTRDGLRREHPFSIALRAAVDEVLGRLVKEEEDRAKKEIVHIENERTRRDLENLAREAARFMQDELREAEAEELPPGLGRGATKAMQIVPGEAVCYLGEDKTLSVLVGRDGLGDNPQVSVSVDPAGVVELIDGSAIPLSQHRRHSDLLIGRIRLRPLVPEVTLIQCEIEGRIADALVTVLEEREERPPEPVPTELEFEQPIYRIGLSKTRVLKLRAPLGLLEPGTPVRVTSRAPGIVVLTGQVTLQLAPLAAFMEAQVRVEGRTLGAQGTIQAVVNDLVAQCRATVTRDEDGPGLRFDIRNTEAGPYRALWEDVENPQTGESVRTLIIQAGHPGLRRYLGDEPDFPGQNAPWTRLLLAEIVADNVCREISRRIDANRHRDERPDSEGFYSEHYGRLLKILPKLQEILLPVVPLLAE
jgi:hypothetical protein